MKKWEMVWLPLAIVMVGVLVALAAKVMLVRPPPGILFLTESMSMVLVLENKEERESIWLLGLLSLKMWTNAKVSLEF